MIRILLIILTTLNLSVSGQVQPASFGEIGHLVEQKNFFKAKETYALQKSKLSVIHQQLIEVLLDNAFNRVGASNHKIALLLSENSNLSDSILLQLYKTKKDNAVKQFDYREAKNASNSIMNNYKQLLSSEEVEEVANEFKIWEALEGQAKQRVKIKKTNRLKIIKDKAGLNNLQVKSGKETVGFIFDTGANLSTATESTAKKMGMKIIPVDIEVGTITGAKVIAQLAVCPILKLGDIEIRNSVFLVMQDEALKFSQIDFQIHGILGFPIIEALKEIQVTRDGYLIVPKQETMFAAEPNMAMDGLTPLILLDNKHFVFDTGADNTILYAPYFEENQQQITANYTETSISFGGAGGAKGFKGYNIDYKFEYNGKNITLEKVSVLKESIGESRSSVYGNIGQDLIKKFNRMTMNFNQMILRFD